MNGICFVGSLPTPNSRQQEQPSIRRGINVSVLSAGGTHSNQESDQNIPSGVLNMLRTLFPGGEIHVEDSNSHRPTSSSAPVQENAPTSVPGHGTSSGGSEAEASVSEEGVFLSNMLRQIMPFVSQHESAEQDAASTASEYTTARGSSAHVSILHQMLLFLTFCNSCLCVNSHPLMTNDILFTG